MNKEDNFKEKFKEALISTVKVISDDYKKEKDENNKFVSKNFSFFELNNLASLFNRKSGTSTTAILGSMVVKG